MLKLIHVEKPFLHVLILQEQILTCKYGICIYEEFFLSF